MKNTGDVNLTNVVVTDQLAQDCNRTAAQTAQLYGETFAPNESFSYTCTQENVQASFKNVVVVKSESPGDGEDPSDDDDTNVVVPVDHPAITIEKRNGNNSGDTQTIVKGETAHFTITVTNTGNVNLTGVVVDDQLAQDCNRTAAQTAQLYGETFTPGETFSYTCKQENVQASFKNVAVVSSDTPDTPDDSDDTDVVVPDKPKNPGIEVKKQNGDNSGDTQTVLKGGTATFTITVKNTGDTDITNVTITDQYVPSCNRTAAQTAQLYGEAFTPGETFSYTCTQENVQASYRNVVVVKGETPDGGNPDDSDDSTVTVPGDEPTPPPTKKKEKCDASIGDLVWNDANKNGIQDNGEHGIADVKLKLYNGDDVERDKTNSTGKYKFKDLCEGDYTVVVDTNTLPNGCYPTYDYDGKLDHKTKVKLDDDEHFKKADFGYYCPQKQTIAKQSPKTGVGTTSAVIATGFALAAAYVTNRKINVTQ